MAPPLLFKCNTLVQLNNSLRAGAVNLMLVTFLIPVSAIALGSAFLGESLAPSDLLGMGLIGLGLAAIDGRILSRLRLRAAE